jgi:hypothetical protein
VRRSFAVFSLFVMFVAACSSETGSETPATPEHDAGIDAAPAAPTMTCAWLKSADNCWLAALKEAASCLPDAKLAGALDATRSTCSYSDATMVTFSPFPPSPPSGQAPAWTFDVTKKDAPCMSFASGAHPLGNHEDTKLTTALGVVELRYDDGVAQMTCPDGKTYTHPRFHELLDCELGVQTLPGEAWGSSASSEYFWLFMGMGAVNPNDHVTVWSCKSP